MDMGPCWDCKPLLEDGVGTFFALCFLLSTLLLPISGVLALWTTANRPWPAWMKPFSRLSTFIHLLGMPVPLLSLGFFFYESNWFWAIAHSSGAGELSLVLVLIVGPMAGILAWRYIGAHASEEAWIHLVPRQPQSQSAE